MAGLQRPPSSLNASFPTLLLPSPVFGSCFSLFLCLPLVKNLTVLGENVGDECGMKSWSRNLISVMLAGKGVGAGGSFGFGVNPHPAWLGWLVVLVA